ncbi:MAG: glycosyltransferase [Planctomycetes bacterium]|nr:glycosyltransferase [Planctomycetota bacterium]
MPTTPETPEPSRMSVALCIGQLEPGGAERCLAQLAVGLDRRRFEPVVYCLGRPPQAPQAVLHEQLIAAGIETLFLGVRARWRMLASVLRLTRRLRERRPAILQTFLYRANVAGGLAGRLARVPHVVAGVRVADPRRFRLRTERAATYKVERFVCVSRSVADYCRDVAKLPAQKLVVIPNSIDVERFGHLPSLSLTQLGVPPGRRALCVVGRLDRQKNISWLLTEAKELLAATPRHDLLIVGEGPQRRKLERQCTDLGLSDRVHFTGWRPDVPQIMAACDLLILPSSWEGMPNVLLEAMASAKPVVATDVEGVRQILGSLAPQQVLPKPDGRLLRERVTAILGNPQLAQRLGQENRLRVQHEYSARLMIEAYEQLYISLGRHTAH